MGEVKQVKKKVGGKAILPPTRQVWVRAPEECC
jgi:hypothetical protein